VIIELVPLKDVLRVSIDSVPVDPSQTYPIAGVYSFGRGLLSRPPILGSETTYKTLNRLHHDDFVLSQLKGWEGAIAKVTSSYDGWFLSPQFPTFRAIPERLDINYLDWYCKQSKVWEELRSSARGMGARRDSVSPERFLSLKIPLPPLLEQRRIVTRIEELAAKINEARELRQNGTEKAQALINSARRTLFGEFPRSDWIPLNRYVAEVENGKSPQCESRPATAEEWGVLKVGAVSFGSFDQQENKALPVGVGFDPRHEVRKGDFLMSRANTTELVGACAIVGKTRPRLLLSDKTFRFHLRPNAEIVPQWLDLVLKSPALRDQIERGASGTSPTMKNISKEKVLSLLLPPHPLSKQRRVVAELDAIGTHLNALQNLQTVTAAELDALLPSILDKAFKEEL
jgi:type I restriction enzyme S subunit